MSRNPRIPSYRLHRATGQAVVVLGGCSHYLGKFGTADSKAAYERVVSEWLSSNREPKSPAQPTSQNEPAPRSIEELILAYWRYVQTYYVKGGKPTSEQDTIRQALRFVRRLYGRTPAKDFGPLALKAIRQAMIDHPVVRKYKVTDPVTKQRKWEMRVVRIGLERRHINKQVGRIKRMFRWALSEELIPAEVYHGLQSVEGLRRGKSAAREKPRVKPVPEAFVDAVLPHLLPPVRAMVELQRLTGMRPGEVLIMRGCDLDVSGTIWTYTPHAHKTEHLDHPRVVYLGPKAQVILEPFLKPDLEAHLFSPLEAEAFRNAERRKWRKTPLFPSHSRRKQKSRRRRTPGLVYDIASYRRAIARACKLAKVPHWHPHQLRHNAATRLRKEFGLEVARAVLGHRSPVVTEIYAELDGGLAASVMAKIG